MDRGFRTGIAHLDPYRINAGVFTTSEDCQPGSLNYRFIYAATCHEISYDLSLWYIPFQYTLYHS
ncbi:hypothetical protein D3C84_472340 [compost metagenome]